MASLDATWAGIAINTLNSLHIWSHICDLCAYVCVCTCVPSACVEVRRQPQMLPPIFYLVWDGTSCFYAGLAGPCSSGDFSCSLLPMHPKEFWDYRGMLASLPSVWLLKIWTWFFTFAQIYPLSYNPSHYTINFVFVCKSLLFA